MKNGKNKTEERTRLHQATYGLELGIKYRAADIHGRITEESNKHRLFEVEWSSDGKATGPLSEAYRLSTEQASNWPRATPPKGHLKPKKGYSSPQSDETQMPTAIVAIFGHDTAMVRMFLRQIEMRQSWGAGFLPIFLTDNPNQSVFRHAGYNLEYFPKSIYGPLEVRELFQERFRLLQRKWNSSLMIDLSKPGYLRDRIEDLDALFAQRDMKANQYSPLLPKPGATSAPALDLAGLRAEYYEKGLNRRPNRFALYRILGNDLPPRHKIGQTLENLKFILENEPPLPNVSKRWVVNRIVNADQEAAILDLLKEHQQPYVHLPFNLEEYGAIDWDFESFPQTAFFLRGKYHQMSENDQGLAEYHVRRLKNQYVINNNGARNAALRDGLGRTKWVLPWDGNCFLTEAAWSEIAEGIAHRPYYKYIVVPMARILDNQHLLDADFRPDALEEPQLIFRTDAKEEFNEEFFYGRRPKVELFWRLGISGTWDKWRDTNWDVPRRPLSDEAKTFGKFGWVARLYSGQGELEVGGTSGLRSRGQARISAVNDLIDNLDQKSMRLTYKPENLTTYDEGKISALADAAEGSAKANLFERLLLEADLALQRGPYSVVDKRKLPASGDPQDYFNPAPYWWPNPDTPTGIPYIFRDGERIPGTRLYEPESEDFDRTRVQRMFDDTTVLALAWKASGKAAYIEHAAELIRTWFISEDTRMNPHLRFSQPRSQKLNEEGSKSGLIEMKDFYYLMDAIRLIEQAGALTEPERAALRDWFNEYIEWMTTADQAIAERQSSNNHGTCFDLQVGAIAAFLGNVSLLHSIFRTSHERILEQFQPDGEQEEEMKRTQTAHYCCFNLQNWINLANLASNCGSQLLKFEGKDGRGLAQAFQWLLPYIAEQDWPFQQIEPFDRDRFLPLYFAAQKFCGMGFGGEVVNPENIKPLFFPHDGIKPFWMLESDPKFVPATDAWNALAQTLDDLKPAVEQAASAKIAYDVSANQALELDKKLWGGFSNSALAELEAIRQSVAADHRSSNNASRSLARWYHFHGDWARVRSCLDTMQDLTPAKERERLLLMIDYHRHSGDLAAALDLAHTYLAKEGQDDPDICLLMANISTSESPMETLAWLNKIYLQSGFSTFEYVNAEAGFSMDNLIATNVSHSPWAMDNGDLVSIIVPILEDPGDTASALKSVASQSWNNTEIILVGDKTVLSDIQSHSDHGTNVKFVMAKPEAAEYELLNAGLAHSTGAFVTVHRGGDVAHPEKLAAQVYGFNSPETVGVTCSQTMVTPAGQFEGTWAPEFGLVSANVNSTMYRADCIIELGGWDPIAPSPDEFLRQRIGLAYGRKSCRSISADIPLVFTRTDLLARPPSHMQFPYGKRRDEYRRLVRQVNTRSEGLNPEGREGSDIATTFVPLEAAQNLDTELDVVVVGDFAPGALAIEETKARVHRLLAKGLDVGLFFWPDYCSEWNATLDECIAELIDRRVVRQISGYEAITAKKVVLTNPYLASHKIDGLPNMNAESVLVYAGPPLTMSEINVGFRRELPRASEIEDLFGAPCEWVTF